MCYKIDSFSLIWHNFSLFDCDCTLKFVQNKTYMMFMVLHVLWENKDLISVTYHEIIQVLKENIIH